MALAPDGDVVVLGFHHDHYDELDRYALWRLNPDGTLDDSFGFVGRAGGLRNLNVIGLAVERGGRILVGVNGLSYDTLGPGTVVARHLPGGALDHSFGIDGLAEVRSEDPDDESGFQAEGLALDPTGDAVIAGQQTHYSTSVGFAVMRLDGQGAPGGVKFDRVHRTLTVRGTLGDTPAIPSANWLHARPPVDPRPTASTPWQSRRAHRLGRASGHARAASSMLRYP
jgi:hypothetical protein